MVDPITISILVVAVLNCVVALFQSIKEDICSLTCCKSGNGSVLFEAKNNFKGEPAKK